MADSLHTLISQVRDGYLKNLSDSVNTLFDGLETKIRDIQKLTSSSSSDEFVSKKDFNELKNVVESQILPALKNIVPSVNAMTPFLMDWKSDMEELKMKIEANSSSNTSKDVIVSLKEPSKDVISVESTSEIDCEANTKFTPLEVDGKTYWLDNDHILYKETEEGYEEIGSYDPETGEVNIEESGDDEECEMEEEVEEETGEDVEEETGEELELEEFEYKGQSYYRDEDNNVYNGDVEQIGIWNGKKIVRNKA
jgi:hypothetical protein